MKNTAPEMTFAFLAGETSGDNLGADLIKHLKLRYPSAKFVGIGGTNMQAQGLESWLDIERLSVNGFKDPLMRLPELISILFKTKAAVVAADPVCFIGIDFNFFNLLLEGLLKKKNIKTVHYVSPTVWAWRRGRIKSIKKKVDLMLTLYPFELDIYAENDICAEFVGHPKADEIDPDASADIQLAAQQRLMRVGGSDLGNVPSKNKLVAMLPGSRSSEVATTGCDFIAAAALISKQQPDLEFIIPAANEKRFAQISALLEQNGKGLPIKVILGQSMDAIRAADVVMVNSGTATLEAMLLKKPMIMSYRLGKWTYAIVSRLVTTKFFALPNILSQQSLVPEFIQADATAENIASAVLKLLFDNQDAERQALIQKFDEIHRSLRKNAGDTAANAIAEHFVEPNKTTV